MKNIKLLFAIVAFAVLSACSSTRAPAPVVEASRPATASTVSASSEAKPVGFMAKMMTKTLTMLNPFAAISKAMGSFTPKAGEASNVRVVSEESAFAASRVGQTSIMFPGPCKSTGLKLKSESEFVKAIQIDKFKSGLSLTC